MDGWIGVSDVSKQPSYPVIYNRHYYFSSPHAPTLRQTINFNSLASALTSLTSLASTKRWKALHLRQIPPFWLSNDHPYLSRSQLPCNSYPMLYQLQADQEQTQKRRTFRKFSYRGVDLDQLLDLSSEQVIYLLSRSIRRPFDPRY